MGARVNFIFKQSDGNAVGLYSHWGEDSWAQDLALALQHAARRKGDESYYIRMAISYFIKDNILDETGYGITAFSYTDSHMVILDHPILIDLAKETITDETGTHSIDSFVQYHTAGLLI
jgi:hypothetical protein